MNDPKIGMKIAIENLIFTGLTIEEIDNQIIAWMQSKQQQGGWRDMPDELISRLARSLQKAFERRFNEQIRSKAA